MPEHIRDIAKRLSRMSESQKQEASEYDLWFELKNVEFMGDDYPDVGLSAVWWVKRGDSPLGAMVHNFPNKLSKIKPGLETELYKMAKAAQKSGGAKDVPPVELSVSREDYAKVLQNVRNVRRHKSEDGPDQMMDQKLVWFMPINKKGEQIRDQLLSGDSNYDVRAVSDLWMTTDPDATWEGIVAYLDRQGLKPEDVFRWEMATEDEFYGDD